MRFQAGQFRGFWGSSGPSQSTTLSFASCSITVGSGSLDCWSWWPSFDMAGFSWAYSKSAAMICCRGWCDSGILARVCSLVPGFLRPPWSRFVCSLALFKVGRVGYSISDRNEINCRVHVLWKRETIGERGCWFLVLYVRVLHPDDPSNVGKFLFAGLGSLTPLIPLYVRTGECGTKMEI